MIGNPHITLGGAVGWTIDVLFYGLITGPAKMILEGLDEETFTNPYLGFLLRDGTRCVLVDCGISDRFIVDGKAWGGFPTEGGRRHVLAALRKCGVTPADVDTVLYTHLHNDHAGKCDLFPAATHIFQRDEWANLVDPLPAQKARRDYDPEVVSVLGKARCIKIDGDAEVPPGVKALRGPALRRARGGDGVVVVDVAIDRDVYAPVVHFESVEERRV